jgi:hypothetical protein
MTMRDARRIVQGVSIERGTNSEYPRPQHMSLFWPSGPPPEEHTQHDLDRIAEERSREDEALQGRNKPSVWERLLGRG